MKLEVGMYVRTDNGIIGKIYKKIGDMFTYKDSNRDHITYGLLHSEITKASYNIINILEAGDYVNGFKVIDIVENDIYVSDYYAESCIGIVKVKDIKSIVTKEQFEQMAYKVVE